MNGKFEILTVSQLQRYIKSLLEEQKQLSDLMVQGEVSNLSQNSASGHLYFSLKDNMGLIRCVMFSRNAQNLTKPLTLGALVVVRGSATLYERDGTFQIVAYDIQELGMGRQHVGFDTLKEQLRQEGLFDPRHKKPLPPFPKTVGIITSRDGAALQDILKTFGQHNPWVRLIVYPASVQGSTAPGALLAALDTAEEEDICDCLIIARGGGSSEDLSAFNDEALARRVFASHIPIISAVGHEVDFTILDFVADSRAATPTAACGVTAPSRSEVLECLSLLEGQVVALCGNRVRVMQSHSEQLSLLLLARSPKEAVKRNGQKLEYLIKLLESLETKRLDSLTEKLGGAIRALSRLNPAALMARGYSITKRGGEIITQGTRLRPGQEITTVFADGEALSTVISFEKKEQP